MADLPADRPRTPDGRLAANYRRRQDEARRRLNALDPADRHPDPTPEAARIFADLDTIYVAASVVRKRDREIVRLRRLERRAAVCDAS